MKTNTNDMQETGAEIATPNIQHPKAEQREGVEIPKSNIQHPSAAGTGSENPNSKFQIPMAEKGQAKKGRDGRGRREDRGRERGGFEFEEVRRGRRRWMGRRWWIRWGGW